MRFVTIILGFWLMALVGCGAEKNGSASMTYVGAVNLNGNASSTNSTTAAIVANDVVVTPFAGGYRGLLVASNANSEECLQADGEGALPHAGPCTADANSALWILREGHLLAGNQGCLAADGAPHTNSTPSLTACVNGDPMQLWDVVDSGLRLTNTSQCLWLHPSAIDRVHRLAFAPCSDANVYATWTLGGQQGVVNIAPEGAGELCLGAAADAGVGLQRCTGGAEQMWTLDKSQMTLGGRCLDVQGGAANAGAALTLQPCTGATTQNWNASAGLMRLGSTAVCMATASAAVGQAALLASCASTADNVNWVVMGTP